SFSLTLAWIDAKSAPVNTGSPRRQRMCHVASMVPSGWTTIFRSGRRTAESQARKGASGPWYVPLSRSPSNSFVPLGIVGGNCRARSGLAAADLKNRNRHRDALSREPASERERESLPRLDARHGNADVTVFAGPDPLGLERRSLRDERELARKRIHVLGRDPT